jgi:glycosyltransferase involved in cell wall biosynthesis
MDHSVNIETVEKLSVIIIAGAEEHNIAACLESVSFAGEIIVVYSKDDDATAEIARRYTSEVHFREFDGYANQKRASLERATREWVFSIDADERVTPELRSEIIQTISSDTQSNGFYVPRKNYVRNKWIRHGGNYPDHQFRLFRREGAKVTQRLVHEGFEIAGKRGHLKSPMLHYTVPEIRHMLQKNVDYARYEALEKRDRRKAGILDFAIRPPLAFIKKYFLAGGFLDGWVGFIFSLIHAVNKLQVLMYLWELQHPVDADDENS